MIFYTLPGARKHLMNNFIKEAISQSEQHDWRKETPARPLQKRRVRRRLKFKDSIKPIEGFSMAEFQTEIKHTIRQVTTIGKDHKINPGSLEVGNIVLIHQSWRGYEWNKKHYAIITTTSRRLLLEEEQGTTREHPAQNLVQIRGYRTRKYENEIMEDTCMHPIKREMTPLKQKDEPKVRKAQQGNSRK